MSGDCMNYPDNWRDFVDYYSFIDSNQVYTNGSSLIQTFRVEQMIAKYFDEKTKKANTINQGKTIATWIPFTFDTNGMLDCPLPDEDEDIFISDGKHVWIDTFMCDIDGYYLDSNVEIEDNLAWAKLPKVHGEG